jgi:hypothetical protein
MNLQARSKSRYNGGVGTKRRWGSSTITVFYVWPAGETFGQALDADRVYEIVGYGPTPGERQTQAKEKAAQLIATGVKGSATRKNY